MRAATKFVFPPTVPSVAVLHLAEQFPVRRVFCVGQNYASHAKEMGHAKSEPFFFSKPADAIVPSGATIPYPTKTANFHHEVELVVAIGRGGANIPAKEAAAHVFGLAVGIDLTRRDMQAAAKEKGRPWDMAKGFDLSAPISDIWPVPQLTGGTLPADLASRRIDLTVNGERRQKGLLGEMTWPVENIVSFLSQYVTLAPGDLIFTGTPEGVGALQPGDVVVGKIEGVGTVSVTIGVSASKL